MGACHRAGAQCTCRMVETPHIGSSTPSPKVAPNPKATPKPHHCLRVHHRLGPPHGIWLTTWILSFDCHFPSHCAGTAQWVHPASWLHAASWVNALGWVPRGQIRLHQQPLSRAIMLFQATSRLDIHTPHFEGQGRLGGRWVRAADYTYTRMGLCNRMGASSQVTTRTCCGTTLHHNVQGI